MELVDYSFSPPTVASLVAAGKHGAGRYVGAGTSGKKLTAGERDRLFAAGLCIWLSVEGQADDALRGGKLGTAHGAAAVRDARALGAPPGVALFGNVDFDVTSAQWPACREYMAGFAAEARAAGYRVGLYGGYNAISWGSRDRVADIFWQTYAWSGGRWHPAAQLQQYRNGVPMGGGDVDLCRAVAADFGQWARGGIAPPQPVEDDMRMIVDPTTSVYLLNGQIDPVSGWPVLVPISVTARFEEYKAAGIPVTTQDHPVDFRYYTRGPLPAPAPGGPVPPHTHNLPASTTGPVSPEAAQS